MSFPLLFCPKECSGEFVLSACAAQGRVHGVLRIRPVAVYHFGGLAGVGLLFTDAAALSVIPIAGGDGAGTIVVLIILSNHAAYASRCPGDAARGVIAGSDRSIAFPAIPRCSLF